MGVSALRELASTLYNDVEQRPELVKQGLQSVGIEKVLGPKEIERLAGWSTRAGLSTQLEEVKEVAAPYLKMDTKELVSEGAKFVKEKATPYVEGVKEKATPYVEGVKEKAAPYVEKAHEKAAPYIAKVNDKVDPVLKDERVVKAVSALKDKFAAVRERPADVARDMKDNALDLIKYEKMGEYRDYVCSETFVSDTMRLVKEDLPALAKEATVKGATGVQAGAVLMKEELSNASAIVNQAWKKGREEHADLRSWEALTGLARLLVAEISQADWPQAEVREKLAGMVCRLKSVFGLGEALVGAPLLLGGAPAEAEANSKDEEVVATGDKEAAASDDEDEKFEDAPLSPEKIEGKDEEGEEAKDEEEEAPPR